MTVEVRLNTQEFRKAYDKTYTRAFRRTAKAMRHLGREIMRSMPMVENTVRYLSRRSRP